MGQQASRCLCHAVNPDHLSACALGLDRPGQDELVTNFDSLGQTDSCIGDLQLNIRTPQGVIKEPFRDMPAGSKFERTVRRRLFEEDQALSLWAQKDGAVHDPLLPTIVAREGARPCPLAMRLGFVSPEPAMTHPPPRVGSGSPDCCARICSRSPPLGARSPALMQAHSLNVVARAGGA